jgi:hypothetical protein
VKERLTAAAFAALFVFANVADARAQSGAGREAGQQTAATTSDVRPSEPHVPLAQSAVAYDVAGNEALGGALRTQALAGSTDAPVRNTRLVVENRSRVFYNYAAGWATFYGADGVRCGEGLWKLEAFAPGEQVEVDTPGLRLTCTPATWRLVATTLLTRTGDVAKPREQTPAPPAETGTPDTPAGTATMRAPAPPDASASSGTPASVSSAATSAVPPLEINVNGKTIPIQLGNPLEIQVGKERIRIVVQSAP